jgi:alkylation response protein AidB-like acyl-CoA dehydrogenase
MDFSDSPAEADFRAGLRDWLREHLPKGWADREPSPKPLDPLLLRRWSADLHRAGYAGITWPAEYGGQGLDTGFHAVLLEEMARQAAPEHLGMIGIDVVGPVLLAYGTAEQKAHYLPRILSGEVVFCLGLSEPEAGSDLASVRTRAVPDGDGYAVTGHKIWSSYAHRANACLLLARTGTETRHQGLTCLLLPLPHPGVAVVPQRQLTGDANFSEILLSGARVPAAGTVGARGDGWRVAMAGLAFERGVLGVTLAARLEVQLHRVVATARSTGLLDDPHVLDRIGALAVEVAGLRWTSYRLLPRPGQQGSAAAAPSVVKLRWSQAYQGLTELALELLGPAAAVTGDDAYWGGYWQHQQLRSLGSTIEGGTSEIQRNVIAERMLGLPRSR